MRHRLEQKYLSPKDRNRIREMRIASGDTSEPVRTNRPKMTKAQKKRYRKALNKLRYEVPNVLGIPKA